MVEARAEILAAKGYLPQSIAAKALRMSSSGLSASRKTAEIDEIKFGREIYILWKDVRSQYSEAADLMELSENAVAVLAAFGQVEDDSAVAAPAKKQQKKTARKSSRKRSAPSGAAEATELS